jgi:hypothetical protein
MAVERGLGQAKLGLQAIEAHAGRVACSVRWPSTCSVKCGDRVAVIAERGRAPMRASPLSTRPKPAIGACADRLRRRRQRAKARQTGRRLSRRALAASSSEGDRHRDARRPAVLRARQRAIDASARASAIGPLSNAAASSRGRSHALPRTAFARRQSGIGALGLRHGGAFRDGGGMRERCTLAAISARPSSLS